MKMTAAQGAVALLESEGVDLAFSIPGAAILPFYQALRSSRIRHILVRHEEGGTHAAEGYTRAVAKKIGVCIGTSGPAGTNMVTGLYSAIADSIPILCITGQAPRAKLHKKDFQAIDVTNITRPVTKWTSRLHTGRVGRSVPLGPTDGVEEPRARFGGSNHRTHRQHRHGN